jgi:prepilin-type processing-associated H-X9-DG protein
MSIDQGTSWPSPTPFVCALANVNTPASTIMVAEKHNDMVVNAFPGAYWGGNGTSFAPGPVFQGISWQDNSYNVGDTPNGDLPPATWPSGPDGAVSATHAGLANFLFCDGHVKAMHPAATNPDPAHHPEEDMWDARGVE